MTKPQISQELKAEFEQGNLKPSQLKKSKSADNLLQPKSTPLTKSKSAETFSDPKYPYTTLISQAEELERLRKESETKSTTIALLRKKNEELEKAFNQTNPELTEFDQNLFARHQNLKDWFTQYQKSKQLDKELSQNIEQASTELITQDQTIGQLRTENNKLKQTNSQLTQDLSLTRRLAELRKGNYFESDFGESLTYFKYGIYALLAVWFLMMLRKENV